MGSSARIRKMVRCSRLQSGLWRRAHAQAPVPPPPSFMQRPGDGSRDRPENSFSMSPEHPLSLFRQPLSRQLQDADVAVLGFPFDSATTNRPGARLGPRGIRQASAHMSRIVNYPSDFNVLDRLNVVDCGDVYFEHAYPEDFLTRAEASAAHAIQAGCRTLGLGGDHFITYPLLRAHALALGTPVSLIHFDAHSDTWRSELKSHGTFLFHAAREGLVDAHHSVQIGVRTWNPETHGFTVIDARQVRKTGIEAVLEKVRSLVTGRPCYVSFDIDCLDPAFAPGTGTPVAGGLTSAEALEILYGLEDMSLNVVGADVVEVSPPYDHGEITAIAAAHVAHRFLHLFERSKARERQVAEDVTKDPALTTLTPEPTSDGEVEDFDACIKHIVRFLEGGHTKSFDVPDSVHAEVLEQLKLALAWRKTHRTQVEINRKVAQLNAMMRNAISDH